MKVLSPICVPCFSELDLNEWLMANLNDEFCMESENMANSVLFSVICWMIGKARINFVFNHVRGNVDSLIRAAVCFASNVCKAYISSITPAGAGTAV